MNAAASLLRRGHFWLASSLRHRVESFTLLVSLLFLLLLGVSSHMATRHLALEAVVDNLDHAAAQFAGDLEQRLGSAAATLARLSGDPLLANALVDSVGRDVYLVPFLAGYGAIAGIHHPLGLCLHDAQGDALACLENGERKELTGSPRLLRVIRESRSLAGIDLETGRPLIHMTFPVVYTGSGTVEGVLATRIDLASLFQEAAGSRSQNPEEKRLLLQGAPLLSSRGMTERPADMIRRQRLVRLPPPLDSLQLAVSVGRPEAQALGQVRRLALWHGFLTLLLIPLAVWLARAVARRLTRDITRLAAAADRITQGGALELGDAPGGPDEIGGLARSFREMLSRLKTARDSLELQVRQRTRALTASEAGLREAQRVAGLGSWEYEFAGDRVVWSDEAYAIFGIAPGTPLDYATFLNRVHPEDREQVAQAIQEALERKQDLERAYRIVLADGTVKHLLGRAALRRDESGSVAGAIGTVLDITRQKETEERLRQAAAVYENTADGVMITRPDAVIVAINAAFTRITGYAEEDVLGATPRILRSGRHPESFYDDMWRNLRETGMWQGEIWNRRKSGEIYPGWLSIARVADDSGQVVNYVGVFSDISRIKESEDALRAMAHHDPLTQLPNRVLFGLRLEHALEQARRRNTRFALLFIDLDRFKQVNDTLGHIAGDELLVELTRRVRQRVRQEDTFARLGGDEFVLLLEQLEKSEDAAHLAREVIALIDEPFLLQNEREARVGASIGIALYPEDGRDATELLGKADTAMYAAKEGGRDTFRFHGG